MTNGLRLVLFGPPGAGKGTQTRLVSDDLDVQPISTGDLFRSNLEKQTPLGIKASEYMTQGILVPDEVTIDIVLDRVMSIHSDDGFILDGFPRNTAQANALDEALGRRSRPLDLVISIDVPEEEVVSRLSGRVVCRSCQTPYTLAGNGQESEKRCDRCGGELYQRDDDNADAVRKRLEVYQSETLPLLDYYRERGVLVEISGVDTVENVNNQIMAQIQRVSKPQDKE